MTKKKSKNIIGVYIDVSEITISVANINNNKITINKTIHIPTEYKIPEGIIRPLSLNNDFFNEKQKWVTSFKDIIKKLNLGIDEAVVSLSHDFSITRFFSAPYLERKYWSKAIPLESKKYIPVAFDELGYDFYAESISDGKIGVVFSVTQKKTTEFIIANFKNAGLNINIVEPSAMSMVRIANFLSPNTNNILLVLFSGEDVYTSVISNSMPIISRYISFSKSMAFSERKSLDLKGSIIFAQRNIPDFKIDKIIVAGKEGEQWISNIERETSIKPEFINIQEKIESSEYTYPIMISASASLKNSFNEEFFIDISEIDKNKRINKTIVRFAVFIGGIISSFFLLLFFINSFKIYFLSKKISDIINNIPEVSELENMTVEEANQKIISLRNIRDYFKFLFNKRNYIAPKLSVLSDIIPNDIWVTELFYNNPLSLGANSSIKVEISMSGETILSGKNRTYYMDYFVKEIKKAKKFDVCNPPDGTIDYNIKDAENRTDITSQKKQVSGIFKISCYMTK